MKIGLLTQSYKPETGAAPNRLYEMMSGLKNCGDDVCIVTAMPNYPTGKIFPEYRNRFSMNEVMDGIEIKRFWMYASNSRKPIPRAFAMFSFTFIAFFSIPYLRKKKLDFLIVGSPPLTLGWAGKWIAKLSKTRFVANISDIWPLSAKELGAISDGRLYRILERMEKSIYRNADLLLGQSQEIVDHIFANGGKLVYLFRNGVDPTRFDLSKKSKHSDNKPLQIIYAGLLGYAQGIADICRNVNFKSLDAELHIYGNGGEKEEIENILQKNPDIGAYYHGSVSRDEVPKKLLAADMTLVPLVRNIYGAVPSKIYESMAAGLPILFCGEGEGAKIVKDNGLGLVAKPKDYKTLVENIHFATSHPHELNEMSQNCIDCATTKFNRPKQVASLHTFMENNL